MIDDPEQTSSNRQPTQFRKIAVRGVVHRYESHGQVNFQLGPLSMDLAAGEVVFIAGGNGSGKTTMAKLLTGLYLPENGSITWDDKPVCDANRSDFRQLFSTIFVEGHLFDRLLGVDVEPQRLMYWLELLGIQDKVDVHTGRLHQDKLSRGQHKRLALLVAALDDRPIFVFDEWAAEQDPGFKRIFYHRIVPELKRMGKTVVAITHDDRYFQHADRVITLADGQLRAPELPRDIGHDIGDSLGSDITVRRAA